MAGGTKSKGRRVRTWKQDPEAVRADILSAATAEFARHGLDGARVQDIADRIQTSKRMIFYYFGDKERLYRAVLEQVYRRVRQHEAELDLNGLSPVEALRRLVESTFDYHREHSDFIRLVMIENIHDARHLQNIESLSGTSNAAIDQLSKICEAGRAAGLFRNDISPLALHWQISALSFFNVANQATFSMNFGDSLFSEDAQSELREQVVNSVLALVL